MTKWKSLLLQALWRPGFTLYMLMIPVMIHVQIQKIKIGVCVFPRHIFSNSVIHVLISLRSPYIELCMY